MSTVIDEAPKMRTSARAIAAARDADVEKWIDQYGVDRQLLLDIPVAAIDLKVSLHNQARFDAFDQPTVDRYIRNLHDGAKFPPIIGYRGKDGRVITIDGNHRVLAHREAAETDPRLGTIAVYEVLDASPTTIAVMTMEANARHGRPLTDPERITHAVWLVNNHRVSVADACSRLGIANSNAVAKAAKRETDQLRAHAANVLMSKWTSLTDGARDRLAALHTDEGLVAAVELARSAGLTNPEINDLVTKVNATKSGEKQVKMIKELAATDYAGRIEETAGGALATGNSKKPTPERQKLAMGLGLLPAGADLAGLADQFKPAERGPWIARLEETMARLETLRAALAAKEDVEDADDAAG